jgi:hypothetical protein
VQGLAAEAESRIPDTQVFPASAGIGGSARGVNRSFLWVQGLAAGYRQPAGKTKVFPVGTGIGGPNSASMSMVPSVSC